MAIKKTVKKAAVKKAPAKKAAIKKAAAKKSSKIESEIDLPKVKKTAAKKTTTVKVPSELLVTKKRAAKKIAEIETPAIKVVASKSKKTTDSSEILANAIVKGMQEKKAHDIVLLDLRNIHSDVTDFYVVCHGSSTTQVSAIADSVEDEVHKILNIWPSHTEGQQNNEWILLDYFDVVVHVFLEEKRDFYKIEKLWADAHITKVPS